MEYGERHLDLGEDQISAKFYESEESYGTVVFCHGFASNKEGYRRRAEIAVDEGFDAAIFDFRGNGDSSREFQDTDLTTRIEDLQRVLEEVEDDRIGVYGSSFGGLVAINAAREDDRIDAIALKAPVTFYNSLDMIDNAVEEQGFYEHVEGKRVEEDFLEDVRSYSAEKAMEQLSIPTLILHGAEDEVVPIEDSRRFYSGLDCEKSLEVIEGSGHRMDDETDREVVSTAMDWFREYL